MKEQAHLLHRFGGHPFAAGLSLPVENLPLFREAINRHLQEQLGAAGGLGVPVVQADLVCTVAELGKELFQELKVLEPCGMGNPVPKLLIENCYFQKTWHQKIKDSKGRKVEYIKTEFEICDRTASIGFPGMWWGHYKDELPTVTCDAIVELDYNSYKRRYEVRLIAVRPATSGSVSVSGELPLEIIDCRWNGNGESGESGDRAAVFDRFHKDPSAFILLEECPSSWDEFHRWLELAVEGGKTLAIAYPPPKPISPLQVWQQLLGIAKYLSRTGQLATRQRLREKLQIGDRTLDWGLQTLVEFGFEAIALGENVRFVAPENQAISPANINYIAIRDRFFAAIREEQFRRQYFYDVPVSTLQAIGHTAIGSESKVETSEE